MPVLHRTDSNSIDPSTAQASAAEAAQGGASAPAERRQPRPDSRTRIGVAWVSIWTTAVVSTALIVLLLQNTRSVEIAFIGLHGRLPLAMALLIAMVGGILLTLASARVIQLRRLLRGRRS